MTYLLTTFLLLLTPVSGVVSGGRLTSFSMKNGLIPASEWMYVPGIPGADAGTFTEVTMQSGFEKCFRVSSSGETAGMDPLVASIVTEDGFAAQLLLGGVCVRSVRDENNGSYAMLYKNITLDLRGSSFCDLSLAGEYSTDELILAGTENSGAFGAAYNICESISLGPAYCMDGDGGNIWFMSSVSLGAVKIISAPAIDCENSYRRLYSSLEHNDMHLISGWNGIGYFSEFSLRGADLIASVSLSDPGIMVGYQPSATLMFLASHSQDGWLQGEIQGKYRSITSGVNCLRSPGGTFRFGFSAGIDVGRNAIDAPSTSQSHWWNSPAVSSFLK